MQSIVGISTDFLGSHTDLSLFSESEPRVNFAPCDVPQIYAQPPLSTTGFHLQVAPIGSPRSDKFSQPRVTQVRDCTS